MTPPALCASRRRLCRFTAVGEWGEKECGVPPPLALVSEAAGVFVALRTRRDIAGCVQAGGGFAE